MVREIAGVVAGPVSAEVVALDYDGMMREAEVLRKIADNIAIKVPLTPAGLKACKALTSDGRMVNVTLCFSAAQALLAAKAGATFISPFVGRHDDVGFDGMAVVADIRLIYDNYDFATEILVASVRHPMHVVELAKIGADVITAPPKIIWQLFKHPLTDAGIASFLKDWESTGKRSPEAKHLASGLNLSVTFGSNIFSTGQGLGSWASCSVDLQVACCDARAWNQGAKTMSKFLKLIKNEEGATAIEYGLIAALIAVAAIGAMQGIGNKLNTTFNNVSNHLPSS